MNILGKRLKEARIKKKLTQIDAAKRLEISNGTLSGYERNYRDPDTEILNRMADLYEVSIDWLLGKTDNPLHINNSNAENDEFEYYRQKIITEFPDIDLMFKEMSTLTADDLKDVYEYIKFKQTQQD